MHKPCALLLLLMLSLENSGLADESKIIESPQKTCRIIQKAHIDRNGDYYNEDEFRYLANPRRNVVLEYGINWAASYYFSPNDKWLFRCQKTGSGDNTAWLYRIDANGTIWRLEQPVFESGIEFLKEHSKTFPQYPYHCGGEFLRWAADGQSFRFKVHGTGDSGEDNSFDRELIYQLTDNRILFP